MIVEQSKASCRQPRLLKIDLQPNLDDAHPGPSSRCAISPSACLQGLLRPIRGSE